VVRDSGSTRYSWRMTNPHIVRIHRFVCESLEVRDSHTRWNGDGVPKEREVNRSRKVCSGRVETEDELKLLLLRASELMFENV
jgi:hypothetical protein